MIRYCVDHTGTACAIDWKNPDAGYVSYITLLSMFSFCLPMLLALLALYKSIPDAAPACRATSASGQQAGTSGGQEAGMSCFTELQLRWVCGGFLSSLFSALKLQDFFVPNYLSAVFVCLSRPICLSVGI